MLFGGMHGCPIALTRRMLKMESSVCTCHATCAVALFMGVDSAQRLGCCWRGNGSGGGLVLGYVRAMGLMPQLMPTTHVIYSPPAPQVPHTTLVKTKIKTVRKPKK